MKKILITGAAGFVPSSLTDALLKSNKYFVVGIDNFLTGKDKNLPVVGTNNYKFIKCDANNYQELSAVMLSFQFDYVFHYAAVVGVKRTTENPLMVLEDIEGIKNVLSLSKNTGVERVFFSSSSEVYGEPVEFPQNEFTTPLNSKLPYAIVKNIGEAFFKSYKKDHNLNYTIFRFFNTYGPKQSSDFVMSRFIRAALKNENITIYGDGSQTRTFCYIDDNIETTLNCLEKNMLINDVINIGADIEISVLNLAKLIIEKTKSTSKIVHLPALEEGDMTRRQPDNKKMMEILNRPLCKLADGIEKVINSIAK
jgi:nucleoside-diphosphate-sugar epimerase